MRPMIFPGGIAATALAALGPAGPAVAGSGTGTMAVSAMVEERCSVSAGSLDFGTVDPTASGPATATATVSVSCTGGTSWSASPDSAAAGTRTMSGASGALAYRLYIDGARARLWGDGSGGTGALTGTGTGAVERHEIHGAIVPGQQPAAGAYSDVVAITITY